MKSDLAGLRETMEALRLQSAPDLPSALVEAIVSAEAENPEDEAAALREVSALLDRHLDTDEESPC
jgi:hypothetical protein